jgi:hypothetical protein
MVYDPWHPTAGPVLDLQFFTEHLFDFGFAEIPEIEPNDVAGDATPLRPGEYGLGTLPQTDPVDFWAAPGTNEGDLLFAYVDTQTSNQGRDAKLTVRDKNEQVLAEDDNDGPGPSPVVAGVPVPAGLSGAVFYEVQSSDGTGIEQYAIYSAVVDPADVADEQELGIGNNDTAATATPLTRTMQNGTLGSAPGSGDVDFYSVLATEGARIVVMLDNDPDRDGLPAATRISILDPNGTEVVPPTSGDGDGNSAWPRRPAARTMSTGSSRS